MYVTLHTLNLEGTARHPLSSINHFIFNLSQLHAFTKNIVFTIIYIRISTCQLLNYSTTYLSYYYMKHFYPFHATFPYFCLSNQTLSLPQEQRRIR